MRRMSTQAVPKPRALRAQIKSSLKEQGFSLTRSGVSIPADADKDMLRELHAKAVAHRLERASALRSKEPTLIKHIASGSEVVPENINPHLVQVMADSEDELLFRYAALHWSIPVSSGYGRRIRFLVKDAYSDKLIGIIGLGDPVFALQARDRWVGWDSSQRRGLLRHVLDAYVLGAVPPFSSLLGGKLVAMLAASNDVRIAFEQKYTKQLSLISGVTGDARVALITTTSALGRSSMYNRLRFENRALFQSVGFTRGSGEFHFANGLYDDIRNYAGTHSIPTAKNTKWGTGFRSRREVVRKALKELNLPSSFSYHGVQREIFVVPLAENTTEFLRSQAADLVYYCQDAATLFSHFRERWLLPRAKRNSTYLEFKPDDYLLWPTEQTHDNDA